MVNYIKNVSIPNNENVIIDKNDGDIKVFSTDYEYNDYDDKIVENITSNAKIDLQHKFIPIFNKYKCKFDIEIICRIAGCDINKLLNDENAVKNIQIALEKTFEKIKYDPEKNNINEIISLAKNYNIALMTGWSIEDFDEKLLNGDSIGDKLIRSCELGENYDFSNARPEEIKGYLTRYFVDYFNQKKAEGRTKEEIVKLQLQDFGEMLINTPPEEQVMFKEAMKLLLNDNKLIGMKTVFASCESDEHRRKLADSFNIKDKKELLQQDISGEEMTNNNDTIALISFLDSNKSNDGIISNHQEIMEWQVEYEKIKIKLENNEELTESEQKILDEQGSILIIKSAELIGIYLNDNLKEEFKLEFAKLVNNDFSKGEDYRKIIEKIVTYVQNNQNDKLINSDEFKNFINNVTNDNYSIVLNDILNGTNTDLNQPRHGDTNQMVNDSINRPNMGLTNDSLNNSDEKPQNPEFDYDNDKIENPTPIYLGYNNKDNIAETNSIQRILQDPNITITEAKKFFNSGISFIRTILHERNPVATKFVEYACDKFKKLSENGQELIIKYRINSKYLTVFASDKSLKVKNLSMYCYDIRKTIELSLGIT